MAESNLRLEFYSAKDVAILGSAKASKHTCMYPCRTAFPWSLLRVPLHGFESAAVSRRNRAVVSCVMMGQLRGKTAGQQKDGPLELAPSKYGRQADITWITEHFS